MHDNPEGSALLPIRTIDMSSCDRLHIRSIFGCNETQHQQMDVAVRRKDD